EVDTVSKFRRHLDKKLADPQFAREYEEISDAVNLGLALADRRAELGYTQNDVAALTGIKQPMLARIEGGQLPTLPTLRRVAGALDARIVIDAERITIEPIRMAQPEFVGRLEDLDFESLYGESLTAQAATAACAASF
ncbi:MAG: helix-turn-helix domain-containing protein, partial [Blastocatellia bacterium]